MAVCELQSRFHVEVKLPCLPLLILSTFHYLTSTGCYRLRVELWTELLQCDNWMVYINAHKFVDVANSMHEIQSRLVSVEVDSYFLYVKQLFRI
jgi:hypothetical protein